MSLRQRRLCHPWESAADYRASVGSAGDVNADITLIHYWCPPRGSKGCTRELYVVFGKQTTQQLQSDVHRQHGFVAMVKPTTTTAATSSTLATSTVTPLTLIIAYGRFLTGSSYVVFGKTDDTTAIQFPMSLPAAAVIHGESENDFSGISVSSAGDINADGLADLIIGASQADPNGNLSGSSYVVFGKSNNTTAIQLSDIAAGSGGFAIHGETDYDTSGTSVSSPVTSTPMASRSHHWLPSIPPR